MWAGSINLRVNVKKGTDMGHLFRFSARKDACLFSFYLRGDELVERETNS